MVSGVSFGLPERGSYETVSSDFFCINRMPCDLTRAKGFAILGNPYFVWVGSPMAAPVARFVPGFVGRACCTIHLYRGSYLTVTAVFLQTGVCFRMY